MASDVSTPTFPPPADAEFLNGTAAGLVRIPSVNPDLADWGEEGGERGVADYTEDVLADLGLEVTRYERSPDRPSVMGLLRGDDGPSLMLNAHYDTVGVGGMTDPFGGRVSEGRLHGRGAYDMKGALAACITAVRALTRMGAPPPGDVLVAAVAGEETDSLGMREVLERQRPDFAVVTEPTGLDICIAHKGFVWIDGRAEGRAAHGSRPDRGVDANLRMVRALSGLPAYADELAGRPGDPLLGPPSVHLGRLRGGTGISTYAAECEARIERRTLPGEDGGAVIDELRSVIGPEVHVGTRLIRDPFAVDPDSRVVRALGSATEEVTGQTPRRVGKGPWTDAALLSAAGVETVVFGPEGDGAHAEDEWVDLDSLRNLADVLALLAIRLGSGTSRLEEGRE